MLNLRRRRHAVGADFDARPASSSKIGKHTHASRARTCCLLIALIAALLSNGPARNSIGAASIGSWNDPLSAAASTGPSPRHVERRDESSTGGKGRLPPASTEQQRRGSSASYGRYKSDPKIPHNLIFTYKHDLLKDPSPRPLHANVLHTIRSYRSFWGEPNATVYFLDDDACRDLIRAAEPRLVPLFDSEPKGSFKADICRVCALLKYGGYYFDIDIGVIRPIDLDGRGGVSWSTVYNAQNRFFQAFLAASPGHPVLRHNLNEMVKYYNKAKLTGRRKANLGPQTLQASYEAVSNRGRVKMLKEVYLANEKMYPEVPRLSVNGTFQWCDYVVEDHREKTGVYFYSRVLGSVGCPEPHCQCRGRKMEQCWSRCYEQ